MFCHQCGTPSKGGSFCVNCGENFTVAPSAPDTSATPTPATPPVPTIQAPTQPTSTSPPYPAPTAPSATTPLSVAGGMPAGAYPVDANGAYVAPGFAPKPGLSTGAMWAIVSGSVVAAIALVFVVLSVAGGSSSEEPTAAPPGNSSSLDSLWRFCAGGDFQACDDLYFEAPQGSDYQAFGDSCGNRNEPAGYCATIYGDTAASSSDRSNLGNDAQLDQLANRCADGDFEACDDLFWQSPIDSDYEEYGARCGNRNDSAAGQCVSIYGAGTGSRAATDNYGSNPTLDRLWDSCSAGNFGACDDLYFQSPSGSPYEYFGDSCGLRNEPAGLCVNIYG